MRIKKTSVKTVACAMSGGVDSSVSALLLKQKGYKVIGVFMQNWDKINEKGICTAEIDREDALYVCDKLRIPLYETNFVKEYWHQVFCEMVSGYENGITPNPDILCNKHIKFGAFYKHVMTEMDVDALATGHYANSSFGNFLENKHEGNAKLLMAVDRWKDQTLFLSQISQKALQNTMFPVGSYYKKGVKKIAESEGLDKILMKRESVGMCFIGARKFSDFIEQYIPPKPGAFILIETGAVIGQHLGTHYWTLGQGALIGGVPHKLYIAKLDPVTQNVYVAPGRNHPSLYFDTAYTDEPYWIDKPPDEFTNTGSYHCHFKYQHVHKMQSCSIERISVGNNSPTDAHKQIRVKVTVENPMRSLTPGQYLIFYKGQECLGSSKMLTLGPSLYEQGASDAVTDLEPEMEERIV